MNKEKMMIRGLVAEQGVEGLFQQALSEVKTMVENYAGDKEKMAVLTLAMTYFLLEAGEES